MSVTLLRTPITTIDLLQLWVFKSLDGFNFVLRLWQDTSRRMVKNRNDIIPYTKVSPTLCGQQQITLIR